MKKTEFKTIDDVREAAKKSPYVLCINPEDVSMDQLKELKKRLETFPGSITYLPEKVSFMYNMISDEEELHWFFDHVIQKPNINESYSAVFVSRHKKLTKEEQEEIGLTRREAEFLATQTFRLRGIKDSAEKDDPELWTFERFLKNLKRFNVDKGAYTTAKGLPVPEKTLAVIFYVNPCDDIKVCKKFVEEYQDVNQAIAKAMLEGKTTVDNIQSYQWFGNAESTIKHLKANQKGSRYWLDYDIDVPQWFKESGPKDFVKWMDKIGHPSRTYYQMLYIELDRVFGKGNYVIVNTSGGYHILVRTSAIKSNPHDFCKRVQKIYELAVETGEEPYLDDKGNCKFECIVNDSQIPGLPLPGTYQYGRSVTVLNKEDFE